VKAKNLMQPAQNFVKYLLLNCLLSLSKMVPCYLSVVQVLLSFAAPPNLHCVLSICERKKAENHYFKSRFINVKNT